MVQWTKTVAKLYYHQYLSRYLFSAKLNCNVLPQSALTAWFCIANESTTQLLCFKMLDTTQLENKTFVVWKIILS